jgi:hypothetical protein
MFKPLCRKYGVSIDIKQTERSYRIYTETSIIEKNKNFINLIKNKQFYDLITELNSDMIDELKIVKSNGDSDNMLILFKDIGSDISLSKNTKTLYFNNTLVIEDDKRVKLIGMVLKNECEDDDDDDDDTDNGTKIDYINVLVKEENNKFYIELLFKYTGKKNPVFVENATAFLFRKLLYRLKCHLEDSTTEDVD